MWVIYVQVLEKVDLCILQSMSVTIKFIIITDASVHLNISADEHLPAGADYPWTTWKALNRLRTQVGRSRVNMSMWGYSNETETCDCGIRQTMQHLLVCPMMDTACSPQDMTTANDIAIGCARHWEGTI